MRLLFLLLWLLWGVYWLLAARNTKRSVRRESPSATLGHLAPLALAALILLLPGYPGISRMLIARTPASVDIGLALTVSGLLLTLWARRQLGRNWSALVAIKHGHELVVSGPYRYVRHPIYSGLILAFAGSCIAQGELRSLIAFVIVLAVFSWKLRREERWLTQAFGRQYQAYRQQVKALVPYVV
ncbi:MAG TPA: isoprenylcysteine carboxylmethyltransferase family protein [Methylophilaceae bacterium]|nr:isoprenylcysteine carboxylmethyltransferase family protein [Methylophilaceae bacterium]